MTREDLYALVWEKPISHLARTFGLSDVGLRKVCVRHNIPTPPLGYWQKVAHGKRVRKPPLPPLGEGMSNEIRLSPRANRNLPEAVTGAHETARERELKPEHKIVVPAERPARFHEFAATLGKILRGLRVDQDGFVTWLPGYHPTVRLGRDSIDRALILMDTVSRALEDRRGGIAVNGNDIDVEFDQEAFKLRLYETTSKSQHSPTSEELKRQAEYDERSRRHPTIYPPDHRSWRVWDYVPSGRFVLELTNPNAYHWHGDRTVGRWYDRGGKPIEGQLSEVMVELATAAALTKHWRAELDERARLEAEEKERQRREQARLERIKRRRQFLITLSDEHEQLRRVEALAERLRYLSVDGEEPFDRMVRVLEELAEEMGARFNREEMNDEIGRLELFSSDDTI